ncbi:MAG: hypothetical protein R6X27_01060 [Candidatus Desulfacyla sp.]
MPDRAISSGKLYTQNLPLTTANFGQFHFLFFICPVFFPSPCFAMRVAETPATHHGADKPEVTLFLYLLFREKTFTTRYQKPILIVLAALLVACFLPLLPRPC